MIGRFDCSFKVKVDSVERRGSEWDEVLNLLRLLLDDMGDKYVEVFIDFVRERKVIWSKGEKGYKRLQRNNKQQLQGYCSRTVQGIPWCPSTIHWYVLLMLSMSEYDGSKQLQFLNSQGIVLLVLVGNKKIKPDFFVSGIERLDNSLFFSFFVQRKCSIL